jgi:sterol desaturase/sphingolipid hydroxylase (fatty acid hydroxylase superfamily)
MYDPLVCQPKPPFCPPFLPLSNYLYCEKIYFYCLHRALHSRLLYKRFHSIHHKYKAPCALESVYVHPVEYVLNSFTALVGPTFLATSPQLFTAMLTTCLFTFLQVHDHTGLWLPFVSVRRAKCVISPHRVLMYSC